MSVDVKHIDYHLKLGSSLRLISQINSKDTVDTAIKINKKEKAHTLDHKVEVEFLWDVKLDGSEITCYFHRETTDKPAKIDITLYGGLEDKNFPFPFSVNTLTVVILLAL